MGVHRQRKLGSPETKKTEGRGGGGTETEKPEKRWEEGPKTAGQTGVEGSTLPQREEACWGLTHIQTEGRS